MERTEALEKLLRSFVRYYNVKTEDVEEPFAAEAEFFSDEQQYFLIKAAKISESSSREFVYFATPRELTYPLLKTLDETAWERGLSQVNPGPGHRNSDVTLIILADRIEKDAFDAVKKLKHYKSYTYRLHGWSNYRLVALELSTGRIVHNRQGETLKKLVGNIQK